MGKARGMKMSLCKFKMDREIKWSTGNEAWATPVGAILEAEQWDGRKVLINFGSSKSWHHESYLYNCGKKIKQGE